MTVKGCALALVVAAAALWPAMRWFENANLYHPQRAIGAPPASWREFFITAQDGVKLQLWFMEPAKKDAPLVLFFHGNGGNISGRTAKAQLLHTLGCGVLLVSYRGYAKSGGKPSEQGLYLDAQSVFDWAQHEFKPAKTVFYGESLGTAVATELAVRRHADALILESPFTSALEMGRLFFPWLPVKLLLSQKYDTLSKISAIRCPLLALHSRQDGLVPFGMGRRVYEAANQPKTFAELSGGHNDGWSVANATYVKALSSFLKLNAF
ncbi:MAG: alpha/beta hydrolase [Candidatus Paceibacterota bacterium]|jgi:hypothetical protein